ncbi:hypothetical protein AADZ91_12005 [Colwelliaceae bacterium 6441]
MKHNSLIRKTITTLLLLGSSSTFAANSATTFKVAVIKNTLGASEIVSGQYEQGINEISGKMDNFNHAMNLCVAQIKVAQFEKAENSCSQAIDSLSVNASRGRHGKLLKALAYSNRGIARHINGKNKKAYDDFLMAKSFSNNPLIIDNITYFNSSINEATFNAPTNMTAE